MEFLNKKEYHGEKIMEQIMDNDKLWIITKDKNKMGNFNLWEGNKKRHTGSEPGKFKKFMEDGGMV